MKKPFKHYRIECGSMGTQETWARSPEEAVSRIKYRLRCQGAYPVTTYWSEPVEVK